MFTPGDTAYILESGQTIRPVKVLKVSGGMATLQFLDSPGGVRLRESRLYESKEAAEASRPKQRRPWTDW